MRDRRAAVLRSGGISESAIYALVERALAARGISGGALADVGCGTGEIWERLRGRFGRYTGVDFLKHERFPDDLSFVECDLDASPIPLDDGSVDVAIAVETIEHLENPRLFVRELVRIVRRDGWVVVTTPNQLSLHARLHLAVRGEFPAFAGPTYPAHITALLESDLRRIAQESGLAEIEIDFSRSGRIAFTTARWPELLSRRRPRAFSDNVLVIGRKL